MFCTVQSAKHVNRSTSIYFLLYSFPFYIPKTKSNTDKKERSYDMADVESHKPRPLNARGGTT